MTSRHDFYLHLREQYPQFIYHGYDVTDTADALELSYRFEIPGLAVFTPTWSIDKKRTAAPDRDKVEALAFSLGMVELISYWKLACPPTVVVRAGALTQAQIHWWKAQYFDGLGEFFYVNGIAADPAGFMEILCDSAGEPVNATPFEIPQAGPAPQKVLIPIGGGKDSAVSIDLLSGSEDCYGFIINPRRATLDTLDASSLSRDRLIVARRTLDREMLRLNAEGYLNGHTPFSAIVAFSSVLTALINGLAYVALSNESSANESTVLGTSVNHQYSKSFDFERAFQEYLAKYIPTGVYYFSLLRPLTEMQIAKYFSTLKEYHPVFRSCNAGSKTDIWCGNCPKCLFVYIILSPFLTEKELGDIFGGNLLEKEELAEDFEKLIGLRSEKPFECVGSRDEVCSALRHLVENSSVLPRLVERHRDFILEKGSPLEEYWRCYDGKNGLPEKFAAILKEKLGAKGAYTV